MEYRGCVALVTGASSGIGAEVARAFAERGARVVGVARRRERLEHVIAACDERTPGASALVGDLAEPGFPTRMIERTLERHGRLDVLVNNAGVPLRRHVCQLSGEDLERALRVNYLALAEATLAALPAMLAAGTGHVVNISSFAAVVTPPREAAYAASKAAVDGFTQGLWVDLADSGVQAHLLHVGPFDTEIWQGGDPPVYRGRRYPPARAAEAVFAAIERGRHESLVPRWELSLRLARWLRRLAPGFVSRTSARMDPDRERLLAAGRR